MAKGATEERLQEDIWFYIPIIFDCSIVLVRHSSGNPKPRVLGSIGYINPDFMEGGRCQEAYFFRPMIPLEYLPKMSQSTFLSIK